MLASLAVHDQPSAERSMRRPVFCQVCLRRCSGRDCGHTKVTSKSRFHHAAGRILSCFAAHRLQPASNIKGTWKNREYLQKQIPVMQIDFACFDVRPKQKIHSRFSAQRAMIFL
jgi:hypothetical protein